MSKEKIKNEIIKVCCDTPLVSTLKFSGAELYCLICESLYGTLNAPVTMTVAVDDPQLLIILEKQNVNQRNFDTAASFVIGEGGHRNGCSQCKKEAHLEHAPEIEIQIHQEGLEHIKSIVAERLKLNE